MTDQTTTPENTSPEAGQPSLSFAIQKIFLKDLSFETPTAREAFTQAWKPTVKQDLNIQVNQLQPSVFEVILLITIDALQEEKPVFIIEVKQAGIFSIEGVEGLQLSHVINTICPQILFPYVREVIDSTLVKGGFPPMMLAPLNFDAIFAQAVMAAQEQAEKEAASSAGAKITAPGSEAMN